MSQPSPSSAPLSDDALRPGSRASREKKRPLEEDSSSEAPESLRPRPLSWHPSAPVEPPLRPTQLRSIQVHSILNPPAKTTALVTDTVVPGREGNAALSPHQSPAVRLPSPALHPRRLSASPGMRGGQIIHPASPSTRFVGPGAPYPRKSSASQSPLAQEARPGLYAGSPTSPLTTDAASVAPVPVSGHPQSMPLSIQSTPTFHSHRTSANPTPNPSSQETSPSTPVSTYSQFGRSSPAISGGPAPLPGPGYPPPPFGTMDPATRLPSGTAGGRPTREETPLIGAPSQPENPPLPGMIPCILDLKSGSSSQAEKRKANSDASRRFRNRKRNEMQMEQKITAQQDEIRKQSDALQRQSQEIQALLQERDFYRAERDFYREHVARLVPASQLPARPASPRRSDQAFRSPLEKDRESAGWPVDAPTGPPLPPTRPPGTWSSAPSAYATTTQAHTERGDESMRSLPQFPGPWPRS
ncbi:hypothetical protein HFD88_000471 [Aspergillus terreus]|nr:hypothetical protein HFD88_000471 [Aspergillus terreus]